MDYFAGLDVSVKERSVCIVDDAVKIVQEARVASEPESQDLMVVNLSCGVETILNQCCPSRQLKNLFSANC
jgi:hypothetical protein